MIAILTKEEVDALTYKECKAALKLLNKTYDMETPLWELPKEQGLLVDDISNTLLWLEDRINQYESANSDSPESVVFTPKKVPKNMPFLLLWLVTRNTPGEAFRL